MSSEYVTYVILDRKFYKGSASLLNITEINELERHLKKHFFRFTKAGLLDFMDFLKKVDRSQSNHVVKRYKVSDYEYHIAIFITDEDLMRRSIIFGGVASAFKFHPSIPSLNKLTDAIKGINGDEVSYWHSRFLEAYKSNEKRDKIRKVANDFVSTYVKELLNEIES